MPGYSTLNLEPTIGSRPWRLRVLRELQPFTGPETAASAWVYPRRHGAVHFGRLMPAQRNASGSGSIRCPADDRYSAPYRGAALRCGHGGSRGRTQ